MLSLVVMAAGIGTRYGGLKQIDPVGPHGESIVDYSVYDALRAGFGRVVFVIREDMAEAFRAKVGDSIARQVETAYVFQRLTDVPEGCTVPPDRRKPWGTGHAVFSCRHALSGPFAVINADDFYGPASFRALGEHLRSGGDRDRDYCMVGFRIENTLTEHGHVARGVCLVDEEGFLVEIHERTRIRSFGAVIRHAEEGENWQKVPGGAIVSMNMWGFTPGIFAELASGFHAFYRAHESRLHEAEFFLPTFVGGLITQGKARVRVLPTEERWFGVTYQQDKDLVKQAVKGLIDRGVYPGDLWRNRARP